MAGSPASSDFHTALSLLYHLYLNPVIGTLVRRSVPDHLDRGPLPASDVAQLAGMDALALTRALRVLTAFGTFQEVSPGVFANNSVSDLFRNRAGGLRNLALYYSSDHFLRSALALNHSVITGESATTHVFGQSFWEHMRQRPEENETFNRALAELRGDEHQQIADAYDWSGVMAVVDVGGGVGSLLAAILQKCPAIGGVLI
ncbi:MAG TPA: methyltransferase, partial [Terriglobales bacterium]|nr:methyltransferase [Terriglobales bacterium]